jgi:hypothetical protein
MTDCWNANHFDATDGALSPQPWMQWRHVASVAADTKAGSYPTALSSSSGSVFGNLGGLFGGLLGGITGIFGSASILTGLTGSASAAGNKNDLLHDIQTAWTNDSPLNQWVYGKITRGGARVSLQARSRGGLLLSSGYAEAEGDAGALTEAGMFGCGADMGNAGSLSVGTAFGIMEVRQHAHTIPLAPERPGWYLLAPGSTFTARATLRFISEFWESTTIDGGTAGTESSYETGDTRLDLFAVPVI